jgi:hypothetical protein
MSFMYMQVSLYSNQVRQTEGDPANGLGDRPRGMSALCELVRTSGWFDTSLDGTSIN